MNKIKEIIYRIKLNSVDKKLTKNAEDIRDYFGTDNFNSNELKDNFKYNHFHLEQLRLMSCRGYLENKLTYVTN